MNRSRRGHGRRDRGRFRNRNDQDGDRQGQGQGQGNRGGRRFQKSKKFADPEDDDIRLNKGLLKAIEVARDQTASALATWREQGEALASAPRSKSIDLDPWQKAAVDALNQGSNVIVDAPTTAGKTRVVETYFNMHIKDPTFRAAYTTPVKSLSNDKLREFREMFGKENVGIATGDIKDNLNAPIVVTTLETYRNSLLGVEPDLGRRLVVFDEYHFMQDESRGSAWEEAIILSPNQCQLLLLSASVANAEDFAKWIETIHHKPTKLVRTEFRPVPLEPLVYFQDEWFLVNHLPQKIFVRQHRNPLPLNHKHLVERLTKLLDINLTPCIVYAGRRLSCVSIAAELSRQLKPIPEEQRRLIGEKLQQEHEDTKALSFIEPGLRTMLQTYGVAYHHSGLPAPVRVAIESLLKHGYLRFCSATMGLSIGINFSVRSALISDFTRPGEAGLTKYDASEVLQMLGRAGRRGRDVVGYSLWQTPEAYSVLGRPKRESCKSRLKNDPTTFLGLVGQGRDLHAIENFYSRSFRRFGDTGVDLSLIRKKRLMGKLDVKETPCSSPANAYAKFLNKDDNALCHTCPLQKNCHRYLEQKVQSDLAALHLHLHLIGALDENEMLTPYGQIAKFFPQNGGLVLAKMIHKGTINKDNLTACAELMACVCLARHKSTDGDQRYKFPFNIESLEKDIESHYPLELFPELYDAPYGERQFEILREFNPGAGYIVKSWIGGMPWKELVAKTTNERFADGDLMGIIYRVATYMQSLSQAHIGEISVAARQYREQLLREPLSITL